MEKLLYFFGDGRAEGNASMKELLGGKGANLAEMSQIGISVPPGFTISTRLCSLFYENNQEIPKTLEAQIVAQIKEIEKIVNLQFGSVEKPLLVSVRSGARISMPGMMDTVLNLGLNDETVIGLANFTGDEKFALDSYRRFIQMYGDVVMGVDHYLFEDVLDEIKEENNIILDTDLSVENLQQLISGYKKIILNKINIEFPQDVFDQLWMAIKAVLISWQNNRAKTYRRINSIDESWGTAVNIQAMVFGNMGNDSATGVAFTRDPSTGEKNVFGEYLINAQGEDVVAGIRTPENIASFDYKEHQEDKSLEKLMNKQYKELLDVFTRLENHYQDMQDIEFTIQTGKLWILQTRSGKRTAQAAIKIAVDLCEEGLITKQDAVLKIDPYTIDQLLHPSLDVNSDRTVITRGLPASPGAACGKVVFDADEAEEENKKGEKVILVRTETSPEDIHGMHSSQAIVTARGGMTSHAAVVARGMGRPCVCGAGSIIIDMPNNLMRVGDFLVKKGDLITIDGGTGDIMLGEVKTVLPKPSKDFKTIMQWADEFRTVNIRTNAEIVEDIETALKYGAEGIGLSRTEHMFFDPERIFSVREMIIADNSEQRKKALKKLEVDQTSDFIKIFTLMQDKPVTIRLLDPPLHEFLPVENNDIASLAKEAGITFSEMKKRRDRLHESNPMLGHRGCRLGITAPEIYEMQVRAIINAALSVNDKEKFKVNVEIMIPLIATYKELLFLKDILVKTIDKVFAKNNKKIDYLLGTMIELPRAALSADKIAKYADFFSFGTNDLTQTTFGISRDDAGSFLPTYIENNIIPQDPFVTLDIDGVGELIAIAVKKGRSIDKDLKIGICGEHGGDPKSIEFAVKTGLNYVSCSPFRIPIARLAAAQAAIRLQAIRLNKDENK